MDFAFALIAIAGGALATYLYDEDAPLVARLSVGAPLGLTAFGLFGFIAASLLGLTFLSLIIAVVLVALPPPLLLKSKGRAQVRADLGEAARSVRSALLRPTLPVSLALIFYALIALMLWLVYTRAMFEQADGIYTGVLNNYGDLPFHLSVITSFARGGNFPPEDPTFAGARFTYPFLSDFVAAMFVRAGANLRGAMLLENLLLSLSLVGLTHRWAYVWTRNKLAAHISPLLLLLSGGMGWLLLFDDARAGKQGLWAVLKKLPHDYTIIPDSVYRWGNALTSLLVPQRSILMGLPLAIMIFIEWWMSLEERVEVKEGKRKKAKGKRKGRETAPASVSHTSFFASSGTKRMIAAGLVAGLLPLVHAHSYLVVMTLGACLALIEGRRRWRAWATFFVIAVVLAAPQMFWATHNSSVRAGTFFASQLGWDRGEEGILLFWLKNTGLLIPLLFAAILWRGRGALIQKRQLLFYLPFTLCFIIPNLFKLAPWIWDNIKVLFYWYVATVPLVALLIARVWHTNWAGRALALALLVSLTLAGGLDVWRVVSRASSERVFDREGVEFAEVIEREAAPRSLILHSPVHNHPVFLTGRRSLMGYPGHIWTHGLDYLEREAEIKSIYAGAPDAQALLERYHVEYLVVSPLERFVLPVNDAFLERYPKIGEAGEYRLYKITR